MFLTKVQNARAVGLGEFGDMERRRFFTVLTLHLGILSRASFALNYFIGSIGVLSRSGDAVGAMILARLKANSLG